MSRHRRGYTLIELTVAVCLLGVLLGLVGTTMQVLVQWHGQVRGEFARDVTLSRIYEQLSEDVERATTARLDANENPATGANALTMTGADGWSVEYMIHERGQIRRVARQADAVVGRERYRFAADCRLRFELAAVDSGDLVSLVIEPATEATEDTASIGAGTTALQLDLVVRREAWR